LQENYAPFEQLFEALVERADVVRVAANTNYPRLELVQTWTVDAGVVTNVIGTNEVITASGFSPSVNGTYTEVGADFWVSGNRLLVGPASGWTGVYAWELYADWADWYPSYGAGSGPESTGWEDANTSLPAGGITAYAPAGVEVNLVTTNVTTTNAFAPFAYSVEVDGTTYSGTGFPHLTYAAMNWIDQQIDSLSDYYSPILPPTNLPPSGAEVWLWQDAWDAHGQYSLIGGAEVGKTEEGTYVTVSTNRYGEVSTYTNAWALSIYTRQPPVASQWMMAEWVWGPTNWVEEISGGETNMVAQNGWIGSAYGTQMELRLTNGASGPLVEAYTTGGVPLAVEVDLIGNVKLDHWWNAEGLVTNVTERVSAGGAATNLFYSLYNDTAIVSGSGTSTGDYVIVSYKGPITLYGGRPYRVYASDFDERAAVIDHMHNMRVEHDWRYFAAVDTQIPAWSNVLYATAATESHLIVTGTNNTDHPPWSDIVPLPFADPPAAATNAWEYYPRDDDNWGEYTLARTSVAQWAPDEWPQWPYSDPPSGYSNSVSAECVTRSAQLAYTFAFATNTCQGTNFPQGFVIKNPVTVEGNGYYAPVLVTNTHPFEYYEIYDYGSGPMTNIHYTCQITSAVHDLLLGTNTYLGGRVGSTNWFGGLIPYNISAGYVYSAWHDSDWEAFTAITNNWDIGPWEEPFDEINGELPWDYNPYYETYTYIVGGGQRYTWRPVWTDGAGSGGTGKVPVPGYIDWGVTNGFRYRAE